MIFMFGCLFFLTFLLEYNCFTMVCQFLLYNKVISCTYTQIPISPPCCISFPPSLSHPSSWTQSTKLISLVLCGCFPLAIYFTFGSVYMSMPLSHFVPAYPSPSPCLQVYSLRLHLYSCPAPKFFKTIFFFRFHIYMLAYGIYFSLSVDMLISFKEETKSFVQGFSKIPIRYY